VASIAENGAAWLPERHRSEVRRRAGIGRRIEPAVRLGNGAQGIGRELVSEMLEVDVLVAVDQRQRRLAYK